MIISGLLPGGLHANNANKTKTTTTSAAVAQAVLILLPTIQKYSHPRFQKGSASCLPIFGNNFSISHWKLILALANLCSNRI
jgi:hypothetical protein